MMKKVGPGIILWGVLLLIIVSIISLFVLLKKRPPEEVEEAQEEPTLVKTLTIEPRTVEDVVRIPGRIAAFREVKLSAENNGRVVELKVDEGDRVEEGDVLLRLDDKVWQAMRKKAAAELADARRDLARFEELEKSGAVSRSDFNDIQLRRDIAEADLEQAEVEVSDCVVKTPISGVVNDRMIEIGEYANEGQAVFEVLEMDRVKVALDVPERDIVAVSATKEMLFNVDVLGDRVFTGEVDFVSAKASRASNSFEVELLLDNPDGDLRPGMIANVDVPREKLRDAIVLPLSAVVAEEGEHIAFVAKGNRAERRVVKLDAVLSREVVVASGVEAGEELIVAGQRSLADGHLIEVKE